MLETLDTSKTEQNDLLKILSPMKKSCLKTLIVPNPYLETFSGINGIFLKHISNKIDVRYVIMIYSRNKDGCSEIWCQNRNKYSSIGALLIADLSWRL